MEFKFGISELSISAFKFFAWVGTTKAEVKGETHGSDIHINNIQVRSQTFKKHYAPSWTILLLRKSSSSFTLNIYYLLTSTRIQKGHRPFQHSPCPQRVHSHETGKQPGGKQEKPLESWEQVKAQGNGVTFRRQSWLHGPCQQKLPEIESGAHRHGESRVEEKDIIWQGRYKKIGGQVPLVGLEKWLSG